MTCGVVEIHQRSGHTSNVVMTLGSKIVALLMTAIVAAGCCVAQAGSPFAPSSGPVSTQSKAMPSGCHEHGQKTPASVPSHDCCRSGHDAAMVQVHSLRPVYAQGRLAATSGTLQSANDFVDVGVCSANLSPTPPGASPLRI